MTPDGKFLKFNHIQPCNIPEPTRNEWHEPEPIDYGSMDVDAELIGDGILIDRAYFFGLRAENRKYYAEAIAFRAAATGWERESAEMQAKRGYWRTIALIFGAAILVGTVVQLSWR